MNYEKLQPKAGDIVRLLTGCDGYFDAGTLAKLVEDGDFPEGDFRNLGNPPGSFNERCDGTWFIGQPGTDYELYESVGDTTGENAGITSADLRARLIADLTEAAATLRRYEAIHRAKGTADGLEKAEVNAALAARFEATISIATGDQHAL